MPHTFGAGVVWPAEGHTYTDPETGACVRQLTSYKAHSHHLYFTNPGWHAGGTRVLVGSDRNNRTNLYSLSLVDGSLRQITDLDMPPPPAETSFLFACVNPTREEAYFWLGRRLVAVNLDTCALHEIYEAPAGFMTNMLNCTADGRAVCTALYEDLSGRFRVDLLHGYVGFREYWAANPLSQVIAVATDGSASKVVWEERSWIGHVNTSPTQPHLLSFCHEGPWDQVDNRIWGLDITTGRAWKVREKRTPRERVGHEYWFSDGLHIGYHGRSEEGQPFYGSIRYDNAELTEAPIAGDSSHFHSNDLQQIVGDGTARNPSILLWRFRDGSFEGPRRLCRHRGSWHVQQLHVHPRLSPDGSQVLYTADPNGYGNVYLSDVPAFESLPDA
jgi:oligogalacturonide lyase